MISIEFAKLLDELENVEISEKNINRYLRPCMIHLEKSLEMLNHLWNYLLLEMPEDPKRVEITATNRQEIIKMYREFLNITPAPISRLIDAIQTQPACVRREVAGALGTIQVDGISFQLIRYVMEGEATYPEFPQDSSKSLSTIGDPKILEVLLFIARRELHITKREIRDNLAQAIANSKEKRISYLENALNELGKAVSEFQNVSGHSEEKILKRIVRAAALTCESGDSYIFKNLLSKFHDTDWLQSNMKSEGKLLQKELESLMNKLTSLIEIWQSAS
jgi:hypothetical protein